VTVGKDALEQVSSRPSGPQKGGGPSRKQLFVLGLAAGVVVSQAWGWLDVRGLFEARRDRIESEEDLAKAEAEAATSPVEPPPEEVFVGPEAPPIQTVRGEIEPGQPVAAMLMEAGLTGGEADRTVHALDGIFDYTRFSRPGHRYQVDAFEDGRLARFEYEAAPDEVYLVYPGPDGNPVGTRLEVELEREVVEVAGEIEHSLWLAFEASGESPALAANLTEAFQFDIDFFHDTRKGDRFRFFVEKLTHRGQLVRYGQIHAAEYIGAEDSPVGTKRLYWYENEATGTKGFYDEEGRAARRAFLRSPLRFTRISSGYGYRRHPILGKRHFHGGIDYAAPTGTPVRAVADGTVTLATYAGANGKIVKIRHPGGYESFYLHLSKILVRRGQRVSQSTLIGKVGSTGRSTGPHLDFRLKRRGKYLNPRQNVAPRTKAVPAAEKSAFLAAIRPWVDRLIAKREVEGEAMASSLP
jgi:murein DD-endopeptidase MepM/ murein hydrolase activator NlpD